MTALADRSSAALGLQFLAHQNEAAMPVIASLGLPLIVHAELDEPAPPALIPSDRRFSSYLASRPASMEVRAIRLLIDLCRNRVRERFGVTLHDEIVYLGEFTDVQPAD